MNVSTMGYLKVLDTHDIDAAIARVTEALRVEGFGVVTAMDMEATFRGKLGLEFGTYRILGACNPALAHAALTTAPELGLLLPCNVVIRQVPGGLEVSTIKPTEMLRQLDRVEVAKVAHDADVRLKRAIDSL